MFFALTLVACGPSPSEVASAYWADTLASRDEAAFARLCKVDRDTTTVAELGERLPTVVAAGKKATVAAREETIAGDTSTVNVAITQPDFSKEWSRLLEASQTAEEVKGINARLVEAIEKGTLPTSTEIEVVTLHKSEEGWCVFRDFATRNKLVALAEEFEKLVEKGDLEGAKSKADAAIALMPNDPISKNMVERITSAIATRARIDAYKPKIEFRNVKVDRICDRCASRVSAEVKNGGDETLKLVHVKISGLDATGAPVWDKEDYPVFVEATDIPGFTFDHSPLRPNYSRALMVFAPDPAPSDWAGTVSVEVKDLEFE